MSGVASSRRTIRALLWLGLLVVAAVVTWFLWYRREHTATTLIYLSMDRPRLLPTSKDKPPLDQFTLQMYEQTQAALAKGRTVLVATLKKPEIANLSILKEQKDPLAWLDQHVHTDFKVSPMLLRISLSSNAGRPEELVSIVNALREAYLSEVLEKENNDFNDKLKHLKRAYGTIDAELQDKRKEFRDKAENVGSREPQAHSKSYEEVLTQDLIDCKKELRRARLDKFAANLNEKDKTALEARERFLSEEETRLERELAKPNKTHNVDLEALRRDLEAGEQVARRLATEIEELKLEAMAPSRVLGIEEAVVTTGE
jgi:hypothetical protein